jgi:hypothetical protein
MKISTLVASSLLLSSTCYAATSLNCQIYNKDQLLTTQTLTLEDNAFPSNWARNNPEQFAANQYKPTLCKSVGLGNEGYFRAANVGGRKVKNVQVYQQAYASEDCKVVCTTANTATQASSPQTLQPQDSNLSTIAQSSGYLAAY